METTEQTQEQPGSPKKEHRLVKDMEYKPDFEIMDRYINFSSELLRLSLLGITGFAGLLMLAKQGKITMNLPVNITLFTSILFFAITAGFALAHRFYASDSMAYHIEYIRKGDEDERVGRRKLLKDAEWALIWAEWTFAIAVVVFTIAVFLFVFL